MPSLPIVYRVDAADRITYVNDAWDAFARQNEGASVMAAGVVGRPLWGFISDLTTLTIYQRLLGRIRVGNELRFSYRCDSPSHRRVMEMQISRADDAGSVEFRSVMLAEEHRQPTPIAPKSLQRMCGWCNRLDVGGAWMEIEEALPRLRMMERESPPMITHGICESCLETMEAELAGM
jgi:hypothetical protein